MLTCAVVHCAGSCFVQQSHCACIADYVEVAWFCDKIALKRQTYVTMDWSMSSPLLFNMFISLALQIIATFPCYF